MEKYYHITSYENLKSICSDGLIPQQGSRTKLVGDRRTAIFLSLGIPNAILMYEALLYHYHTHAGNCGLEVIKYYKSRIRTYHKFEKELERPLDEEEIAKIEAMYKAIEQTKQLMKYKSFSEYLEDGVYLTISGITNINCDNPKDCYTCETIPPEKIKVVRLKNKITREITDHREHVLTYFMSTTPIESIIEDEHNVIAVKGIKDLYSNRLEDIQYYNQNNFEVEEVSLDSYISKNRHKKMIKVSQK